MVPVDTLGLGALLCDQQPVVDSDGPDQGHRHGPTIPMQGHTHHRTVDDRTVRQPEKERKRERDFDF